MDTLGERIKAVRVKLGLTQEEFAKRCGVHRRSQVNYELNKRHPGENYIYALEDKFGVDSIYVMTGEFRSDTHLQPWLSRPLIIELLVQLGYSEHDALLNLHAFEVRMKEIAPTSESSKETLAWTKEFVFRQVKDSRLTALANQNAELDSALLGDVLAAVDSELQKYPGTLPTDKKGRLVASTYRNAKVQGKIDMKLLVEAVSLAV